MLADDGIRTVVVNDAITITMPPVATSVGRKITFVQLSAAVLTIAQNADDANIAGADTDFIFLDAASDYAEVVSDGLEWLVAGQAQMTLA